ncbi:MAG: ATP-binding cassette domain-containing protein, partial [Eubacteriales bacterium]|nr:ATP-binding cassette domain-containing protein [Eubacteriales bacterium]
KTYHSFEKSEGLKASLRSLFVRKRVEREALRAFSFEMEKGEFLGLMGPNGAGKSTLIKVLTGIVHPTSGTLRVLGCEPFEGGEAFKRRIAVVMGQKSQLWWDLPAADTLLLQKSLYELDEKRYRRNLGELTERFGVEKLLHSPVRSLSLGERMKFELICALMHDPELLFLDEPTLGLDASAQLQIRRILKETGRDRGVSLLLTSHYTQDLLELTPRVLVIRDGEKLYDGDMTALLHRCSQNRIVRMELTGAARLNLPRERIVTQTAEKLELRLPTADVREVVADLFRQGVVGDVTIEEEDVAELVERLYQKV